MQLFLKYYLVPYNESYLNLSKVCTGMQKCCRDLIEMFFDEEKNGNQIFIHANGCTSEEILVELKQGIESTKSSALNIDKCLQSIKNNRKISSNC